MWSRKFIPVFLCIALIGPSLLPIFADRAYAFGLPDLGSIKDAVQGKLGGDSVPTGNFLQDSIMGVLNGAAIAVAQGMVNRMVDSTIEWANTGFEGNPAYVTSPSSYFGNIANGIAGGFIQNSSVGFLCSPIQNINLKISLAKYYTKSSQYQPQCTLTGIKGNIDNFYQNFDNGGWNSFIQLTQDSSNNPYGAYVDAQIQLDTRVANALGTEQQKLTWNQGFKSKADCKTYNPTAAQIADYENGVGGPGTIAGDSTGKNALPYNESYGPGKCIEYGPDKTPGSMVKDQLEKVTGSGFAQLMDVKKFDELVNAVVAGLIQRTVFSSHGVFTNNHSTGLPTDVDSNGFTTGTGGTGTGTTGTGTGTTGTRAQIECFADRNAARLGDQVFYQVALNGSQADTADFMWTGDEIENASSYNAVAGYATDASLSITYYTTGLKVMAVTASTTEPRGNHRTFGPVTCTPQVVVASSTDIQ